MILFPYVDSFFFFFVYHVHPSSSVFFFSRNTMLKTKTMNATDFTLIFNAFCLSVSYFWTLIEYIPAVTLDDILFSLCIIETEFRQWRSRPSWMNLFKMMANQVFGKMICSITKNHLFFYQKGLRYYAMWNLRRRKLQQPNV